MVITNDLLWTLYADKQIVDTHIVYKFICNFTVALLAKMQNLLAYVWQF